MEVHLHIISIIVKILWYLLYKHEQPMKYFAFFDIFSSISQSDQSIPYMIVIFILFILMLSSFALITIVMLRKVKKSALTKVYQETDDVKPANPFTKQVDWYEHTP